MTNFTYTKGRPAGQVSPAAQRAALQQNTDSAADIWNENHYGFNDNDGGTHRLVVIPNNNTPASPTGLASAIYTATGTAEPSGSQLLYAASNGIFPLSCIRAFAVCSGVGTYGSTPPLNGFNVDTVSRVSANGTLTVNLTSGVLSGTSYAVLCSNSQASSGASADQVLCTYTIVSSSSFTIRTVNVALNAVVDVSTISFLVMQL